MGSATHSTHAVKKDNTRTELHQDNSCLDENEERHSVFATAAALFLLQVTALLSDSAPIGAG
jgi:hypothetical protein